MTVSPCKLPRSRSPPEPRTPTLTIAHGRPCTARPDALAEGVGAVAAVADHPQRDAGKTVEQGRRRRQLVRLTGGYREGDRAPSPVGDDARLGAEPAARAAEGLA